MLQCHHHPRHHHYTLSPQIFPLFLHHTRSPASSIAFLRRPTTSPSSLSALPPRHRAAQWLLSQLPEPPTPPEEAGDDGPIELFPSSPSIFATTDDPSPLQVTTSVLLTGSISLFLFRSIRRRARRAKELKFRSTGAKKTLKEEALDSLKAMGSAPIQEAEKSPSPVQALLGAIAAGVIALILYKFATTIEASLNRQTISDNFSVRQITITIRTIINGLCYLATFVFGFNSIGLFLYAGQLAINSFMEADSSDETETKATGQSISPDSASQSAKSGAAPPGDEEDQNL